MMIDRVQINLVTSSGPTRMVNGVAPGLRVKKFRRLGHDTTLTEEMNSFYGDDRKMISDDPLWVYYVPLRVEREAALAQQWSRSHYKNYGNTSQG